MLNNSLLLPFICGCLPPLSAQLVSYGTAGGHGCNPSPLSVKCAEQTDPEIRQRLDTLAVYLRAEPFWRPLWPHMCERVTRPSVFKTANFTPFEVTTLEHTLKTPLVLSGIIFVKRLTKFMVSKEGGLKSTSCSLYNWKLTVIWKREFYSWLLNVFITQNNISEWHLGWATKPKKEWVEFLFLSLTY